VTDADSATGTTDPTCWNGQPVLLGNLIEKIAAFPT
jgi:hypothetical protein